MNSTTPKPETQAGHPRYLIASRAVLSEFLRGCDHAQTLTARDKCTGNEVMIILPCKQWSCRFCAETKIRILAAKTREAKPNRLLTLTINPANWQNPRAAFDGTRRQVPVLINSLRKKFHEIEYLRVTELTRKGWPHYHLLVRSNFLPQPVVAKFWNKLTGAPIVDLRQVRQSFAAYQYLVKYLSKIHHIEWTERHVSYSRSFFPPEPEKKPSQLDLFEPSVLSTHPTEFLMEHHHGSTLERLSEFAFFVHPPTTTREDF